MSALPGESAAPVTVSVAGAAAVAAAVGRWVGTVDRRGRVAAVTLAVRPDGTVGLETEQGVSTGTWGVGDRPGVFTWQVAEELVEDGAVTGLVRIVQSGRVLGDDLTSTGTSTVTARDGTVLREVEATLSARRTALREGPSAVPDQAWLTGAPPR